VIVAITNEIMNAIQKENCSIADEYILEVNDLFCYIEAYKFLTSKSEMSELEITVINELTRKIIDSWNRIFPIEVPASMINTRELLRRYIDNEQMDTTTDISFSCDSQFFPLLCEQ
jgi:hypothetical protein